MSWFLLVVAGLLEVAWASVLPATGSFTRVVPTAAFLVLLAASMVLLSVAAASIPLGTAYAVWVGIGAVGATVVGIVVRHEPATLARLGFLSLLVVSVVGLKLVSDH
jgi:quaternary ammonium compound-resistance protein SugE